MKMVILNELVIEIEIYIYSRKERYIIYILYTIIITTINTLIKKKRELKF